MNTKFTIAEQSELGVVCGLGVCVGCVFGAEGVAEGVPDVEYWDVELVEIWLEADSLLDVGGVTAWILEGQIIRGLGEGYVHAVFLLCITTLCTLFLRSSCFWDQFPNELAKGRLPE